MSWNASSNRVSKVAAKEAVEKQFVLGHMPEHHRVAVDASIDATQSDLVTVSAYGHGNSDGSNNFSVTVTSEK